MEQGRGAAGRPLRGGSFMREGGFKTVVSPEDVMGVQGV
jgi:hypothetical protein